MYHCCLTGRVAATEKELEATLASQPQLALAAEHDLQAAVKELFATSDAVSEEALEEAREVVGPSQVRGLRGGCVAQAVVWGT